MANCTSVGSPGTKVSLSNNPIPNGVIVTLIGYAQSAGAQTVAVLDNNGNVVAQIASKAGNSSIQAMLTSSGSGVASFTSQAGSVGPYSVRITNSGGQTSQVLSEYQSVSAGTTTYAGTWEFLVEDTPNGGDCDFNDATVYLTWNLFSG